MSANRSITHSLIIVGVTAWMSLGLAGAASRAEGAAAVSRVEPVSSGEPGTASSGETVSRVEPGTVSRVEPGTVSRVEPVSKDRIIATARASESDRYSLAGLSGVHVEVSGVMPQSAQQDLTEVTLQTDVEMRLRKAGIRTMNPKEILQVPGTPHLTLKVTTHEDPEHLFYAFGIELALVQDVVLLRDTKLVGRGATWSTGAVGLVGIQSLRDIRFHVWEMVDQFAKDYQAADQKR
ncbi:MAG: hypothetical protein ACE5MG_01485 [Candidatus Methylomirabilales bacterium]